MLLVQGWGAADVVLDDRDWRSPGLVASAKGIDHAMLPSLLLKTDFEEPGTRFELSEPGFLQYRVLLKTEDRAITPYLKRVTVARWE